VAKSAKKGKVKVGQRSPRANPRSNKTGLQGGKSATKPGTLLKDARTPKGRAGKKS